MLDADAPALPRRVLVAGLSGAGKTTLARRLAGVLDVPHTEIDALHHGPGWVPRPQFLDDVRALAGSEAWVTEWQYRSARPLLAARADLLVWLDQPYPLVLARLVRRTVRRRVRREVLWNGNVEGPLHHLFTDPEHVVRYQWVHRHKYRRDLVPWARREHPDLPVVRLTGDRDVERWVADLAGLASGAGRGR
ncbi:adenylate kinase family enzyme [Nocardioides marinisabuli]|uniref:Adenylate kinase family enzyme n=1 Tax=Nocardioides marinisabuli TaxID=419476 RepID=A0A7Y9EZ24_9ACTN|nr:AAA family ATPase [Nocardioides marinisabuli]NYD56351.1 adenylate kinase family enzyme [Nocardioides marinisabuli]